MLAAPGCIMLVSLSLSLAMPQETQPSEARVPTGFLYKTLAFEGETYAYSVFVPPEYTADQPWPVILALHGSGERGMDGFLQTEVGIGTALRKNYRLIPAIVVMPQCRPGKPWVGPMTQMALKCVEAVSQEYHCDRDRVYLTGLSLGGQGAWYLAAALPNTFAAVVPLCGFLELGKDADPSTDAAEKLAARMTHVPIWAYHGEADTAVPVTKTREVVAAIRKAGGNVHYTEYKDLTHNVWDRTYADPELWRWLFAQRRGATTQPAGGPP